MSAKRIVQVALPVRLRRLFDYRVDHLARVPDTGARVLVSLQKRKVVGIVCASSETSALPLSKLKAVSRVLDDKPLLPKELFRLLLWAAAYYHHPIGDVLQTALPVRLRRDCPAEPKPLYLWRISDAGRERLGTIPARYAAQRQVLELLVGAEGGALPSQSLPSALSNATTVLARLETQGFVEKMVVDMQGLPRDRETAPTLN
ncbi:MAG TPA: hypothetical protein DIC24_00525, partial [Gammaproteobacteria bacterium]|nr:hypothetical protein [Gammaproteobacteria bacterium]